MTDVLVTGAAGFVGAALVHDALRKGLTVAALIRPGGDRWRLNAIRDRVALHEVDLLDRPGIRHVLRVEKPSVVFHMAAHGAYSWQRDADAILSTNVIGTASLIAEAAEAGVGALLHAGSSSEYGLKDHAARESEPLAPNSVYAVGKVAASHLIALAAGDLGLKCATARLYSVYGPWEAPERLVPRLVVAAMNGTWPPLAAPSIARDFVYVDDVVGALWALAECETALDGTAYNVCSGIQTTLSELVDEARAAFGVTQDPQWGDYAARSWDTSVWVGDPRLIAEITGWRPSVALGEGMRAFAKWLSLEAGGSARY